MMIQQSYIGKNIKKTVIYHLEDGNYIRDHIVGIEQRQRVPVFSLTHYTFGSNYSHSFRVVNRQRSVTYFSTRKNKRHLRPWVVGDHQDDAYRQLASSFRKLGQAMAKVGAVKNHAPKK